MGNVVSSVSQVWSGFLQLLNIATAPACVAILLAIGCTQVVKMLEHRLPWFRRRLGPKKLRRGEIWLLAWLLTVVVFPVACWVLGVPVRANLPLGIAAGFLSPFLPFFLKKIGLDLDAVLKRKEEYRGRH